MYTPKFLQNQRRSHHHPFDSHPFGPTTLELYPRMRPTEHYRQPAIPEEYQVREFEHPRSLDCSHSISINELKREKIIPPNNSEMRVLRDSYFS